MDSVVVKEIYVAPLTLCGLTTVVQC